MQLQFLVELKYAFEFIRRSFFKQIRCAVFIISLNKNYIQYLRINDHNPANYLCIKNKKKIF